MTYYDIDGNEFKISAEEKDDLILISSLPTVFIESEIAYASITKDNNSNGTFTFVDRNKKINSIPIKFKLQGSGSLNYAKHNLNITFYEDDTYAEKKKYQFGGWLPVSKIHLKANEFDYSMVRNSVGSRLTHDLMGKFLPNGADGYIDSFPCILYYNDEYMGCHTVNLPQDGKTYNFKDSLETVAKNLAYRNGDTSITVWTQSSNWEYRGDADEVGDMRSTFNSLLSVMSDYSNLTKAIIEQHFDVDTLVAYWTLADIMLAVDSLVNNWTLVTWDGVTWYHVWYDLDLIFGLGGNDGYNLSATYNIANCQQYLACGFWQKITTLYATEIADMYANLRNNGVNADNLYNAFHDFQSEWGWRNIAMDREKWASDKLNTNEISKTWIANRLAFLDNKYNYTES